MTLRAVPGLASLRGARLFPAIRVAIRLASHECFGVAHFSVQSNHVHLLVEANGREALIRGIQGLAIRVARAVNRALARKGKVWGDRYHSRALRTPREVRSALLYVLMNWKKHRAVSRPVDLCSSGPWFDGWLNRPAMLPAGLTPPVAAPRTWLLQVGWRRHGLVSATEKPRPAG